MPASASRGAKAAELLTDIDARTQGVAKVPVRYQFCLW